MENEDCEDVDFEALEALQSDWTMYNIAMIICAFTVGYALKDGNSFILLIAVLSFLGSFLARRRCEIEIDHEY